jgi:hypothetical protein
MSVEVDEESKDSVIGILHELDDKGHVAMFIYAHVTGIRVAAHDTVVRGQALGTAWVPKSQKRPWPMHVHVSVAGAREEKADPSSYLRRCSDVAPPGEPTLPVNCTCPRGTEVVEEPVTAP